MVKCCKCGSYSYGKAIIEKEWLCNRCFSVLTPVETAAYAVVNSEDLSNLLKLCAGRCQCEYENNFFPCAAREGLRVIERLRSALNER
jgi:hypothetical protein